MTRITVRPSTRRNWHSVIARVAVVVALLVVYALLWVLIVTMWIDAASRSIPSISAISGALWS
jgi:hypothetical protein